MHHGQDIVPQRENAVKIATVEVWQGLAYVKGQRLCLLKFVWAGISNCILKMARFLETIN
jgi:hypothetical protein